VSIGLKGFTLPFCATCGYYGLNCATHFGETVPPVSV
jgi:hypothetical protein